MEYIANPGSAMSYKRNITPNPASASKISMEEEFFVLHLRPGLYEDDHPAEKTQNQVSITHTHSRCSLHIVFTICQPIVYSNINLNNMS